jgi:hypothetical protein
MGTRSTTTILNEENEVLAILYRQFDGYESGHGQEIFEFLKDKKLVNGISSRYPNQIQFNGMSDLGVRLITHLKNLSDGPNKPGGFYLNATLNKQGYDYTVYAKKIDESKTTDYYTDPDNYRIALKLEAYDEVRFDDYVDNWTLPEEETDEDE